MSHVNCRTAHCDQEIEKVAFINNPTYEEGCDEDRSESGEYWLCVAVEKESGRLDSGLCVVFFVLAGVNRVWGRGLMGVG